MAAAMHILSNTLSVGKICATWNERDIPSCVISREGLPVISLSSNRIVPLLGFRWPVTMLMNVVLPAPFAPITPTVCSGGTLTVMSRAATSEPKVFSRSRTARMGEPLTLMALHPHAHAGAQRVSPVHPEETEL